MATKRAIIKLVRTSGFDDDYGLAFDRQLDRLVGGKARWQQPPRDHRTAVIPKTSIKVRRCEDGPEFELINLGIAGGQLLVATIALWFSLPKREKARKGERFIEIRTPDVELRVKASDSKAGRQKQLARLIRAISLS